MHTDVLEAVVPLVVGGAVVIGALEWARQMLARRRQRPLVFPALPREPHTYRIEAVLGIGGPFRGRTAMGHEMPPLRDALPTTIDVVRSALVHSGFSVSGGEGELVLRRGDLEMFVGFAEPLRVSPQTMVVSSRHGRPVIDFVHALVPVFGAMAIDYGVAAWIVVDGARSADDLDEELTARFRRIGQDFDAIIGRSRRLLRSS